jgi:phosphoribosyl 1,2-cyclic phosphodiesterase
LPESKGIMKLTFLGTRGEIDARTAAHQRHASITVGYRGRRIMIDAGRDWLGRMKRIHPQAIVLTHAHPDHAGGLTQGAPCTVFACPETWQSLGERSFPLERRILEHRKAVEIHGVTFEAFPVEHSILAPRWDTASARAG